MIAITGLYSGTAQCFQQGGERTGIFKQTVDKVDIDDQGIIGDIQVDKRFHGGPEKALHQFSVYSYHKIADRFSDLTEQAIPGSIGENISTNEMDDKNVNIGDVYRMGNVVLQVSQPRRPCWKINQKFDNNRLVKFLTQAPITGWYYRVIEAGSVSFNDQVSLIDRHPNSVSIHDFNSTTLMHRPELDDLQTMIDLPDLSHEIKSKLASRLDYLKTAITPAE